MKQKVELQHVREKLGFDSGVEIDPELILENEQVFNAGTPLHTVQYTLRWMEKTARMSGMVFFWILRMDPETLIAWMVDLANSAEFNTPASVNDAVRDSISEHLDDILAAE